VATTAAAHGAATPPSRPRPPSTQRLQPPPLARVGPRPLPTSTPLLLRKPLERSSAAGRPTSARLEPLLAPLLYRGHTPHALALTSRGSQPASAASLTAPRDEPASKQAAKAQIKAQLANKRRAKGHTSFMSRYGLDPNTFAPPGAT
jgi:hypothetical protein